MGGTGSIQGQGWLSSMGTRGTEGASLGSNFGPWGAVIGAVGGSAIGALEKYENDRGTQY